MKRSILAVSISLVLILLFIPSSFALDGMKTYRMEGIELFKGIDIGDIRVLTTFAGQLYDETEKKVGIWVATLRHRDYVNIEVCGKKSTIIKIRLELQFGTGGKLVLGNRKYSGIGEAEWNWIYDGEECDIGGLGCEQCPPLEYRADCGEEGGFSDIAEVSDIELKQKRGSTFVIEDARLTEGFLCHYFPFIPRVIAYLEVEL
jgi:hypothetical protein